jgi:hypothetical protein
MKQGYWKRREESISLIEADVFSIFFTLDEKVENLFP